MNDKNSVLINFIWRFAERTGAKIVSVIVSILLARMLSPDDYGTIALITVFISILQTFVDSGMGNALIQKKDADDLDFSSVFYFNILLCVLLYGGLYYSAPLIAWFFNDTNMIPLIRVLGISILLSGVKNIQQAYVSRNLQFKRFFFSTLGGTIGSAAIGIIMAYKGMGAWALVYQHVSNLAIGTLILWITVKWKPRLMFSIDRLKSLFSFGWKLLVSSLLDKVYNELRQMIIGKRYSKEDLAFYNRGKQFPDLIVSNVNTSIDSVLLPTMSNEQDNTKRVLAMTRRAIRISTYVIAPLMMGLAFTADTAIPMILTNKWIDSIFFMRIFCITYMFYPIHTANLNAIKAMGRSDIFLKLEIIKKIIGIIAILLTMWISVKAMAWSLIFTSLTSQIINSAPNKKLLGYSYFEQMKDILPSIVLSVFMGVCIWPICCLDFPDIIILFMQVVIGGFIYICGSRIFKLDSFVYLNNIIKKKIKKC